MFLICVVTKAANQPIAVADMLDAAWLYKNILGNTFTKTSQKFAYDENVMSHQKRLFVHM